MASPRLQHSGVVALLHDLQGSCDHLQDICAQAGWTQCCKHWDWHKPLMAKAGRKGRLPRSKRRVTQDLSLKKCQTQNTPSLVDLDWPQRVKLSSSSQNRDLQQPTGKAPSSCHTRKVPGHPKRVRKLCWLWHVAAVNSAGWGMAAGFNNYISCSISIKTLNQTPGWGPGRTGRRRESSIIWTQRGVAGKQRRLGCIFLSLCESF